MAIQKQQFYEGAALHLLARTGTVDQIRYEAPFFVLNDKVIVHLKYSTRGRSPWGFTFVPDEQVLLLKSASKRKFYIGLVCGADGVAALSFEEYRSVASPRDTSIRVACYRLYGQHYEVRGPDGTVGGKVAPSSWLRILA